MKCKVTVCSSVGMKRKVNQDNFYVNGFINKYQKQYIVKSFFSSKSEQLLCICDGMGGEKHGEVASYIAVQELISYREKYSNLINCFDEHANAYSQSANNAICSFIKQNSGEKSGSTMALLCISPEKNEAVVANLGDSKVFLYRKGILKKVSYDHNMAQILVNIGMITEEESTSHKDKSKLTQHLGIFHEDMIIEPFISDNVILEKGDLFLICSDGLTDMLTYKQISSILQKEISLKNKCVELVNKANENGGDDNITVVLAEII